MTSPPFSRTILSQKLLTDFDANQVPKKGATPAERGFAYRELFKTRLSEEDLHLVRRAAHYCQPIGDDRFRQQIEQRYDIKLGQMGRGRPRKDPDELLII